MNETDLKEGINDITTLPVYYLNVTHLTDQYAMMEQTTLSKS